MLTSVLDLRHGYLIFSLYGSWWLAISSSTERLLWNVVVIGAKCSFIAMTLNLLLPLFNVKLRILICSIFELTRVSILLFEICYLLDIFVIVLIGLCCY